MSRTTYDADCQRPGAQRAPSRWLPCLTLTLLAEMVLLMHLLPKDPVILDAIDRLKAPYREAQRASRLAELMKADPRPGTRFASPETAPLIRVLRDARAEGDILVLFTGPCSTCIARELATWRELAAKQDLGVVIVSRDSPDAIQEFVEKERFPLPVLPDPDGSIARALNAIWIPRAYAMRGDGTLTWIQANDRMTPEGIAGSVWSRNQG